MGDIVQQLRTLGRNNKAAEYIAPRAADLIEQLRSDLSLRDQTARYRKKIIAKLEAEIERLRADKDVRRSQERNTSYEASIKELEAEIERLRAFKTPASAKLLNITKACLDNAEEECKRLRSDKDVEMIQNDPDKMPFTEDGRRIKRLIMKKCPTCHGSYAERMECSDGSIIALNAICFLCQKGDGGKRDWR